MYMVIIAQNLQMQREEVKFIDLIIREIFFMYMMDLVMLPVLNIIEVEIM